MTRAANYILRLPPMVPIFGIIGVLLTASVPLRASEQIEENGRTGAVTGTVIDARTEEVVGHTVVHISELDRWLSTPDDGKFVFPTLPPGTYTLKTFRIGYENIELPVSVTADETTRVTIRLQMTPITTEHIVVTAGAERHRGELQQPAVTLAGKKLRENLGRTIAETIDNEPGVAQRSMGPAPARPVLRGLSGDRLLILEDGSRTGDLSATSADHAVAIEPLAAEQIEVVRGPAALMYGANTLGGVVNIVRGYVPASLPDHIHGASSLQAESVNSGIAGGLSLTLPLAPIALRFDGSYRSAQDISTPAGDLANTTIETGNGSIGLSYIKNWGHFGASGSYYNSSYGIPPDPLGGHPGGVNINLERRHLEARLRIKPQRGWLEAIEVDHTYSRYFHEEIESNGSLGIEFGVVTHNFSTQMRMRDLGWLRNGVIGIWGEYRDHASGGLSFTPRAFEYGAAAFAYQEAHWGPVLANATLRIDLRQVDPEQARRSATVGDIRTRSFTGISGGLSARYRFGNGLAIGATGLRTFRAPGVEELFSEGPHLASYSYEVGNAGLPAEKGVGLELFVDYKRRGSAFRLAFFRNAFDNFTYPNNTGERSRRRYDLLVYQYVGQQALMQGAEVSWQQRLGGRWHAEGTLSYVRGELTELNRPIPRMPPLSGKFGLKYASDRFAAGAALRLAAAQRRLGDFEQETAGYAVADLSAEYLLSTGSYVHTLALSVENLLDSEYRVHLNRVKAIMPEPGRNVKLLYKVYF